jgi:hypothetical protein
MNRASFAIEPPRAVTKVNHRPIAAPIASHALSSVGGGAAAGRARRVDLCNGFSNEICDRNFPENSP